MKIFQVDAFSASLFSGNPASVCVLETWLPDNLLQKIAAENNQAETAFVLIRQDITDIRWFTPTVEVDLCGHATLAAAHVLYTYYGRTGTINFDSVANGRLPVWKSGSMIMLDFPADPPKKEHLSDKRRGCFSISPTEVLRGKTDLMFVFENEAQVCNLVANLEEIEKLDARGVIVTAPGHLSDFVSRFFAPQSGIPEDPVTGSAHTTLAPYWAVRCGKTVLHAQQVSKRGGSLVCEYKESRVIIGGYATTYFQGTINLPSLS